MYRIHIRRPKWNGSFGRHQHHLESNIKASRRNGCMGYGLHSCGSGQWQETDCHENGNETLGSVKGEYTLWSYLLKKRGNVYFKYFFFPILPFANLYIYILQTEMKVIYFILTILCWILVGATSPINMCWGPTQRYVVDKLDDVHRCSVMQCTTICKSSLSLDFPLYFHSQHKINWVTKTYVYYTGKLHVSILLGHYKASI